MQIQIEVEGASKVGVFLETFPRETSKAALRSVKRGNDTAGTHANRVISRDVGLRVSDVRERIRKVEPTLETLTGELRGPRKRIPVSLLGPRGPDPSRGRGSGIRWRGGSSARAFFATMRSGHRGVFERKGIARLPIRELFGPSIGSLMNKHRREILARGEDAFLKELDRLLDRIIQGNVGGGDAG